MAKYQMFVIVVLHRQFFNCLKVSGAVYGTLHFKEPFKSFKESTA